MILWPKKPSIMPIAWSKLYNASNKKTEEDKKENFSGVSHCIALAELIAYIEDKNVV